MANIKNLNYPPCDFEPIRIKMESIGAKGGMPKTLKDCQPLSMKIIAHLKIDGAVIPFLIYDSDLKNVRGVNNRLF